MPTLTRKQSAFIAEAKKCHAAMTMDDVMEPFIAAYAKPLHLAPSARHLFEELVFVIDARGDQHSDERLMAWAMHDPKANEVRYW